MISDANKAVNDLASIVPLLGGSSSRKDYEEARKLVEYGGVSGNPRKFRHSALWNFLGGWSAA